jgi:hypothetical protein
MRSNKVGIASPFAGKLKCIFCGNTMYKVYAKKVPYLCCKTKLNISDGCNGISIPYYFVENKVLEEVQKLIGDNSISDYFRELALKLKSDINELADLEIKQRETEKLLKDIQDAMLEHYIDKVKNRISEDDLVNLLQTMDEKVMLVKHELSIIYNKIKDIKQPIEKYIRIAESLSTYKNIVYIDKRLVEVLIDHIDIGYEDSPENKVLKIHWSFETLSTLPSLIISPKESIK